MRERFGRQATARGPRFWIHHGWLACIGCLIILGLADPRVVRASDAADAEALVIKARLALENFRSDPDMVGLRRLASRAWGVFIMPQVFKGGFIVGGSGGNGVLIAREGAAQPWRGPAFYTVGGISFGLQIGAELSEVVMLIMTNRGLSAMLSSNIKLGADVNVAIGPVGAGAEAATAGLSVDLLVFSRSKGLYGGISLQGAVVSPRDTLNRAFYGQAVSATDILIRGTAQSDKANKLLAVVSQFPQEP